MKRKTNYKKRLGLLKSGLPRLVVRKTDHQIIAQLIEYDAKGDKTISSAYGKELAKYGWDISFKNIPAAYLLGVLIAKKSDRREAILDKGSRTLKKDSFIYYLVKGAQNSGLNLHAEELPVSDDRMFGAHIMNHLSTKKGNQFAVKAEKIKNIKQELDKALEKINSYGK